MTTPVFKNQRGPLDRPPPADLHAVCNKEFNDFPTPQNLNYFWNFGAIAGVMLVLHDRHRHRAGDALHAARRLWPSTRSSASCATSTTAG